jgi:hypothetical protein
VPRQVRPCPISCHVGCPVTVNASIRAAPERMLIFMSLLKRGLPQKRFGDQLASTCYAEALVKDLLQGQKPFRRAHSMHRLRTLLPLCLAFAGTWIRPCIPVGLSRFLARQRKAKARLKATRPGSTCGRYDQILAEAVRELKNSRKDPRRRAESALIEGHPVPPHTWLNPTVIDESVPRGGESTLLRHH